MLPGIWLVHPLVSLSIYSIVGVCVCVCRHVVINLCKCGWRARGRGCGGFSTLRPLRSSWYRWMHACNVFTIYKGCGDAGPCVTRSRVIYDYMYDYPPTIDTRALPASAKDAVLYATNITYIYFNILLHTFSQCVRFYNIYCYLLVIISCVWIYISEF